MKSYKNLIRDILKDEGYKIRQTRYYPDTKWEFSAFYRGHTIYISFIKGDVSRKRYIRISGTGGFKYFDDPIDRKEVIKYLLYSV